MSSVNIIWYPYRPQYNDDVFLEQMFERKIPCGLEFNEVTKKSTRSDRGVTPTEGGVVIASARAFSDGIFTADNLNTFIARMPWVLLIVTGDEEHLFPYDYIHHRNKKVWAMMPQPGVTKADRYLPCGYPLGFLERVNDREFPGNRDLDWFFAGQINNPRRQTCVEQLRGKSSGKLIETLGFMQGISQERYYDEMSRSKIIPCPAGINTPDSFRLVEAMEYGCVPIADFRASGKPDGYWEQVFQNPPFRFIDNWEDLPRIMNMELEQWSEKSSRVGAWWAAYKRQMAINLRDDINKLLEVGLVHRTLHDKITVVISSSPIPSHPSTAILEKTIASIRYHLPTCEILILLDGVRPEQEHRRSAYEEYKRAVVWKCQHQWKNILPVVFDQFEHQAGMMMKVIDGQAAAIHTPLLFFVEHDMQILPREIDWEYIVRKIEAGAADSVRLYQQEEIVPVHQYLMCGKDDQLIRTSQYSQHPHVATVQFYHKMLEHFRQGSKTMIEDFAYTFIAERPWDQWKLAIYAPPGGYKRIEWVDGRDTDPKYDMIF